MHRKKPTVIRNYFETSHGKNVCDGLGATVKNACYHAILSNRKVIGNADDVYKFCQVILKWKLKQPIMNETQCPEEKLYSLKM